QSRDAQPACETRAGDLLVIVIRIHKTAVTRDDMVIKQSHGVNLFQLGVAAPAQSCCAGSATHTSGSAARATRLKKRPGPSAEIHLQPFSTATEARLQLRPHISGSSCHPSSSRRGQLLRASAPQ